MNFLAHLYLSGSDPMVQIGNFIGDHVKGRQYERYAPGIRTGILLHRKIDHFTDQHPIVKTSSTRLREKYGRYSGIIIDVFYDHFLAQNWGDYHEDSLKDYVSGVHRLLLYNYFKLPRGVKRFLPFLVKSRRLETYATAQGIERALKIMSGYSSLPDHTDWAMLQMENHYSNFNEEFKSFFQELREMAQYELFSIQRVNKEEHP